MKADVAERRVEDIVVALRRVVEENSQLLGKTVEYEAQVKRNAATSEEKSRL